MCDLKVHGPASKYTTTIARVSDACGHGDAVILGITGLVFCLVVGMSPGPLKAGTLDGATEGTDHPRTREFVAQTWSHESNSISILLC